MKDYEIQNKSNSELNRLMLNLASEMTFELDGVSVYCKDFTDGEILEVRPCGSYFNIDISTSVGIKTFVLDKAFGSKYLTIEEGKEELLNGYIDACKEIQEKRTANTNATIKEITERAKQEAEKRAIELERIKQLKAEKELAEKKQKKIQNEINKFNDLKSSRIHINFEMRDTFYYNIGWCAKHINTISAAMPDFLESYFVGVFGNVKRRVVDSKKVGPSGYTSQWSLSMTATLDTADNVPPTLTAYMSKGKNKMISKLSYVYMLCEDYGFKFGSEQDINAIRKEIPEKHMAEFEAGYND